MQRFECLLRADAYTTFKYCTSVKEDARSNLPLLDRRLRSTNLFACMTSADPPPPPAPPPPNAAPTAIVGTDAVPTEAHHKAGGEALVRIKRAVTQEGRYGECALNPCLSG